MWRKYDHEIAIQIAEGELLANAKLITAAPELLEALKYIMQHFGDDMRFELRQNYLNLIARAEGRDEQVATPVCGTDDDDDGSAVYEAHTCTDHPPEEDY